MKEFAYREVGAIEERDQVVKRDLMLFIDDRVYQLSVGTHQFIDSLKQYNKQFDEELQLDDNILPMDSVVDLGQVVEKIGRMPWEIVAPYLVEQDQVETDST